MTEEVYFKVIYNSLFATGDLLAFSWSEEEEAALLFWDRAQHRQLIFSLSLASHNYPFFHG